MVESLPVLIITFNRPEKFRTLLDNCRKLGVRKIYVAIDGGQSLELKKRYESAIQDHLLHHKGTLFVLQRKINLGLATSVMSAVDIFFQQEIKGIILEDDLVFGREFLDFCDEALVKFADNEHISMISGNQFFPNSNSLSDISIGHYPLIWGWATWRDRWQSFRKSLEDSTILETPYWIPLKVKYFWLIGFKRAINCEIDSWAIIYATYVRFRKLICIYPVQNLVSNMGYDSAATHTSGSHWTLNVPVSQMEILDIELADAINVTESIERDVYNIRFKHKLFYFTYWFPIVSKKKKLVNTLSSRINLNNSEKFRQYV